MAIMDDEEASCSTKRKSKIVRTEQLIQAQLREINEVLSREEQLMREQTFPNLIQSQKGEHRSVFAASSSSTLITCQSSESTHILPSDNVDLDRNCWICFGTEAENRTAEWVQPCKCSGSTKWVHQACLYRWVDEKQQGNELRAVCCQQCKTEYIIVTPQMDQMANFLEIIDNIINRFSPFLAAGVFIGSLYWTPVTYGAVTFLQVFGHKKGLAFMENRDPILLLIGLPTIPIILILLRMIRWEDAIIYLIRNRRNVLRKIPIINRFVSRNNENEMHNNEPEIIYNTESTRLSDTVSITRIFCGALLLPTISSIIGRVLFESVDSILYRTILGGLTFITIKGILKIYLRQQQYIRRAKRCIMDYTEDNIRAYGSTSGNDGPSTSHNNGNNSSDSDSNGDTISSTSSSIGRTISGNSSNIGVAAYVVHQIPFQTSEQDSRQRRVHMPTYIRDNVAWASFSY